MSEPDRPRCTATTIGTRRIDRSHRRGPPARDRAGRGGADRRPSRRDRGSPRHREVDAVAYRRPRARRRLRVRRGQRRTHTGTPGRSLDPARVMAEGYDADVFVDGPLASGAARRVAAVRRGDQPCARGDAERPDHRDERGRTARSPSRSPGGGAGIPARGSDESVRRDRDGAHLGAVYDRVCRLAVDYQTATDERQMPPLRHASGSDRSTPSGTRRSSNSCGSPAPTATCASIVRTPANRHVRGGIVARGGTQFVGRRRRRLARCCARRAVGYQGACERTTRSTRTSSAGAVDDGVRQGRRRQVERGKAIAPTGATPDR